MWASRPGRAVKMNPTMGMRMNSKGISQARQRFTSAGRGGRRLASMMRITSRKTREMVRMVDEIWGTM